MAIGRSGLRRVQLGKESSSGTAVAATTFWRGNGRILDEREIIQIAEEAGILGGVDRTAIAQLMAGVELEETPVTFEQFPYLTAMAFGGPTSGTQDGTGDGYKYETTIPTTSTPTTTSYTVEAGDDTEVEEVEYCVCTEFSVSGVEGELLQMTGATLAGRQSTTSSFTGGLSRPSVEEVKASLGAVYLDDVDGSYGTTAASTAVRSAEITFTAQWRFVFGIDNNQLYFESAEYAGHEITGSIVFYHDTTALNANEKGNWRNETARLLRLEWESPDTFDTTGTDFDHKTLRFDLPIKWDSFGGLERQDGLSIVTADFTSKYNATSGDAGTLLAVNENDALA